MNPGRITSIANPQRGNVTYRGGSVVGTLRDSLGLTRREVVTLATLNHDDPHGVPQRHCDVAVTFGVTRSAISQRFRRALAKLSQHPDPQVKLYAARLRQAPGRRIQLRTIKLSRCENV
jgi:hypothetical protein